MTFEIGAGAFTICAAAFVFGLLSSTPSKASPPHRSAARTVGALVVETPRLPSVEPTPSPTPGAPTLPNTSEKNPPTPAPASRPIAPPPTGGTPKTSPTPTPVVDRAPTPSLFVTPSSGSVPLSVVADASGSTDTDGSPIANFVFTFGDGTPSISPLFGGSSASHTYLIRGTYTVTVVVTDTAGHSSSSSWTVRVG